MKKILVIKLGALGDFVVGIGQMMELKELYPDAEFTLMTHKSLVPIAKQMGMFSNYIIDNRLSYWNLKNMSRLLREVLVGEFDVVIDFQVSSRTEKRYYPILRWFMPKSFTWIRNSIKNPDQIHVEKKRACSWGVSRMEQFSLALTLTDLTFLHGENKHFDELPDKFVLFIPGCSPGNVHKRWPSGHFSELARRLAERGIHSVLVGTKDEAAEMTEIAESTPMVCNMMGKTSLLDIPDLAVRSLAAVGNNTGPSHMAALSGVPIIALYATRTKPCSIRGKQTINIVSPGTIDLITVDMVWEKLQPFIEAVEK